MQADRNKLILIVEDDDTLRLLVSKQLNRLGFQSESARNGSEAVEKFSPGKYAMILMDVQMPKMDGLEATRMIREEERKAGSKALPIVALTANPDRERCMENGMDDFLFKPVMVEPLKALLGRWVLEATDPRDSEIKSSSSIA